MASLLQCGKVGSKIDVEWHPIKHQSRDRLDARLFRLADSVLFLAQVNDFDGIFCLIERMGDTLFSLHANRAPSMVEYRFIHFVSSFLFQYNAAPTHSERRMNIGIKTSAAKPGTFW